MTLSILVNDNDFHSVQNLSNDQRHAVHVIMHVIEHNERAIFFVDGPGGTGKTYLYRAAIASLRKRGHIVLANATLGIAIHYYSLVGQHI